MPNQPQDIRKVTQAETLLRAELGIAPGGRLEVWHGVTIDQALRVIEAARQAALEEAAKVAERMANAANPRLEGGHDDDAATQLDTANEIAAAIRSLIGDQP